MSKPVMRAKLLGAFHILAAQNANAALKILAVAVVEKGKCQVSPAP